MYHSMPGRQPVAWVHADPGPRSRSSIVVAMRGLSSAMGKGGSGGWVVSRRRCAASGRPLAAAVRRRTAYGWARSASCPGAVPRVRVMLIRTFWSRSRRLPLCQGASPDLGMTDLGIATPLPAGGRFIAGAHGQRVRLAGVNWYGGPRGSRRGARAGPHGPPRAGPGDRDAGIQQRPPRGGTTSRPGSPATTWTGAGGRSTRHSPRAPSRLPAGTGPAGATPSRGACWPGLARRREPGGAGPAEADDPAAHRPGHHLTSAARPGLATAHPCTAHYGPVPAHCVRQRVARRRRQGAASTSPSATTPRSRWRAHCRRYARLTSGKPA